MGDELSLAAEAATGGAPEDPVEDELAPVVTDAPVEASPVDEPELVDPVEEGSPEAVDPDEPEAAEPVEPDGSAPQGSVTQPPASEETS